VPGLIQFDQVLSKLDPYADQVDDLGIRLLGVTPQWKKLGIYGIALVLLITVLAMMTRPDFPNLMVGLFAFYYYVTKGATA
jgi:hypothetical protein